MFKNPLDGDGGGRGGGGGRCGAAAVEPRARVLRTKSAARASSAIQPQLPRTGTSMCVHNNTKSVALFGTRIVNVCVCDDIPRPTQQPNGAHACSMRTLFERDKRIGRTTS